MEKRVMSEDLDIKPHQPVLVRIDKSGCAPHDIHIDKNEVLINIYQMPFSQNFYLYFDSINFF